MNEVIQHVVDHAVVWQPTQLANGIARFFCSWTSFCVPWRKGWDSNPGPVRSLRAPGALANKDCRGFVRPCPSWRRKRDTSQIVSSGRLLPRNIAENIDIKGRMRSCSLIMAASLQECLDSIFSSSLRPVAVSPNLAKGSEMTFMHLNQIQLAARWNISHRTLERWRWSGEGPQFIKIGGRVVYRLADIEAYELMQIRKSTSDLSQQLAAAQPHA
jgi:hypothetical protein